MKNRRSKPPKPKKSVSYVMRPREHRPPAPTVLDSIDLDALFGADQDEQHPEKP